MSFIFKIYLELLVVKAGYTRLLELRLLCLKYVVLHFEVGNVGEKRIAHSSRLPRRKSALQLSLLGIKFHAV
jgi:hypothetical protein